MENYITSFNIIAFVASALSIALAIIAIWLSLHFYDRGKGTEKDVAVSLSSIKAQTETLQKITGRQLNQLTKYATQSHPSLDAIAKMINAVKDAPSNIANTMQVPSEHLEYQKKEIVSGYIGLYYYTAIANVFARISLYQTEANDSDENSDEKMRTLETIKDQIKIIDLDFEHLKKIVSNINKNDLSSNQFFNLYKSAEDIWKNYEMDYKSTDD